MNNLSRLETMMNVLDRVPTFGLMRVRNFAARRFQPLALWNPEENAGCLAGILGAFDLTLEHGGILPRMSIPARMWAEQKRRTALVLGTPVEGSLSGLIPHGTESAFDRFMGDDPDAWLGRAQLLRAMAGAVLSARCLGRGERALPAVSLSTEREREVAALIEEEALCVS